jgi:Tol biopolymer transport system component
MPKRARFLFVILAAVLLGCQPEPAAEVASPPTNTPAPPPIPTRPRLTPTATFSPTFTAAPTATPLPIQMMSVAFGTLRDGKAGIYFVGADGQLASPWEADDAPDNLVWPDISPDGTRIVFAAVRGNGPLVSDGLFVSGLDGEGLIQLTEGDDRHPRWSPDGAQIAYTCEAGQDVCVIDAAGGEPANLTADSAQTDMAPAWTPDGRIVFMSARDLDAEERVSEIYIMEGDGSNPTRLTDDETAYNAFPAVSPDGSQIVFESDRDVEIGAELYLMDIDGANQIRLTNDPAWNQNPAWSPDGARIMFAANYGDGNLDLYLINADGTNRFRLTGHLAEDGGLRLGHTWLPVELPVEQFELETPAELPPPTLPDGAFQATDAIIFTARNDNCDTCLESGIYTVHVDGSELSQLPIDGLFPAWSPDFRRIAFVRGGELFMSGSGGESAVQITHALRGLGPVRWSADGGLILAACSPYGERDVCVIDLSTGAIKNLSEEITGDSTSFPPYWYRADQVAHGTRLLDLDGALLSTSLPAVGRVSPDGSQLVTLVDRQITLVNPGDGSETQLTTTDTLRDYPVWSPEGDFLIYTAASETGSLYLNAIRVADGRATLVVADPIAAEPTPLRSRIRTYLGYNWAP